MHCNWLCINKFQITTAVVKSLTFATTQTELKCTSDIIINIATEYIHHWHSWLNHLHRHWQRNINVIYHYYYYYISMVLIYGWRPVMVYAFLSIVRKHASSAARQKHNWEIVCGAMTLSGMQWISFCSNWTLPLPSYSGCLAQVGL